MQCYMSRQQHVITYHWSQEIAFYYKISNPLFKKDQTPSQPIPNNTQQHMQLDYISNLQQLFREESPPQFQEYYHENIDRVKSQLHRKMKQYDKRLEISASSETNQTTPHQAPLQPIQEEESIQSTFKSLTGSQVLKIYADHQFYNQLLSNQQEYPRQIDQILWRITYLLGQVLMQIQNSLIDLGYLSNSVILPVGLIKEAAFRMVEVELANRNEKIVGLSQVKQNMLNFFEEGELQIEEKVMVYNFVVKLWKKPLDFSMDIEPNKPIKPPTKEADMQTDPIIVPVSKPMPKNFTPKLPNNNFKVPYTNPSAPPPKPGAAKYPPNFQIETNRNLVVSQVTPFNPKEPIPGKKAIQRRIKRAKSRIQAMDRPVNVHLHNKRIRQKLTNTNTNDIYEEQTDSKLRTLEEQLDKHIFSQPNLNAEKNKPIPNKPKSKISKLDAVKDKMAMLNQTVNPPLKNTNPHTSMTFTPNMQQKQGRTNPNNIMDLCNNDEKITLDQKKNRLICRQKSTFKPTPFIGNNNIDINQNILKGSFGPNFPNNKMVVPYQVDKKMMKQGPSSVPPPKGSNPMFLQNNRQITPPKRPQAQNARTIPDSQIIDLNPNKPINLANSSDQTINNQSNMINLSNPTPPPSRYNQAELKPKARKNEYQQLESSNVKLQQKLEDSAYTQKNKINDKLNLPEEILAQPTAIQPITIPIIAEDNSTIKNNDKQQKEPTNDQKEQIRKMRERWVTEQQKILTQTFIEKGDQVECSRKLQQVYGTQNPKHSLAGVRYKIDSIVRKVHQKFCSLNTKNQNIRRFKQNWQFIRKRSSMSVRRRIYKEIVSIYTAMFNMTEQKRQLISCKIAVINRICMQQNNPGLVNQSNPNQMQGKNAPNMQ